MRILDAIFKWLSSLSETQPSKPKDRQAWIVPGGKVYHLYPGCPTCKRSKKTPIKTTEPKARARGLRECGMCQEMLDRARRV